MLGLVAPFHCSMWVSSDHRTLAHLALLQRWWHLAQSRCLAFYTSVRNGFLAASLEGNLRSLRMTCWIVLMLTSRSPGILCCNPNRVKKGLMSSRFYILSIILLLTFQPPVQEPGSVLNLAGLAKPLGAFQFPDSLDAFLHVWRVLIGMLSLNDTPQVLAPPFIRAET